MNRSFCIFAAVPLLLVLAGCGSEQETTDDPPAAPDEGAPASAPSPVAEADDDGSADLTPAPLTPEAERGEAGARNVLLSFARAIELDRIDQAYAMLGETDRSRWSRAQFAALFADLDDITVAVPGGTMEGAAGSSYYTAPATLTAEDANGGSVRHQGEIVLRRVNDVPGATPEQLRWHIERVDLDRTR